jgi:hypothetical protein
MSKVILALFLVAIGVAVIAAPEDFNSIQLRSQSLDSDIQAYSCPADTSQLIIDAQALLAELQNFSCSTGSPSGDYAQQVADRPTVSTPTVSASYYQFDSIAYAGALGLNQQGGLPHPCTTALDAVSNMVVEYGNCEVRMDFYPDGVRAHGNGHLMIPQPTDWDRGEGTLIVLYEHIDGEASPVSVHPDIFTFNNGQLAGAPENSNYRFEARQDETSRELRMGGTDEGTTKLTWTGIPDNWDGGIHIEIVSWSQTDSYLMIDGVNYGTKGGLQNAGVYIPTVDNPNVEVVQEGTPRLKFIYSMMSRSFMSRSLAEQLSANLFDWAD